jgi:hypothetical protein
MEIEIMETQAYEARPSFRLLTPGVRVGVGLAAATAAISLAAFVFGTLSDRQTFALAGVTPVAAPAAAKTVPQVRVASSFAPAAGAK